MNFPARLVLLSLLLGTACSSSDDGPPRRAASGGAAGLHAGGSGAGGSGGNCMDCPDAAGGTAGADAAISAWLPETHATSLLPVRLNAQGAGTARLTSVSVIDNRVALTFLGAAHRGVMFAFHDWTSAGYTLFDVISIAEDGSDFAVTYLYCVDSDLQYAYTESFKHAIDWEPMSGDCDVLREAYETDVDLPALSALPDGFDSGVSISGTGLNISSTGGNIQLSGSTWEVTPFTTVDCTDCPDGPWLEVHSLLRSNSRGCFGILYLYPEDPQRVLFGNSICLPDLSQPVQSYDATWSGMVPMQLGVPAAPKVPPQLLKFGWRLPPAE